MVFCGPLFDMHPRYMHFKDLMMDFFRGQTVDSMEIDGLQHVICISAGEQNQDPSSTKEDLPPISFRAYLIGSKKVAGSKVPKIELEEMGPRMDLKLGRWQEPNEEMMSMALKKPKPTTVLPLKLRLMLG
jgi:ribosome production factor 2